MESIVEKIRATSDPNALEDDLFDTRQEIREAVRDSQSTFNELKTGMVAGLMKITVPAGFAAVVAAAPMPPQSAAILAGTGIAISAINLWSETQERRRAAKRTSPYHYLTLVRSEIRPKKQKQRGAKHKG
jgi:hypothetical protein